VNEQRRLLSISHSDGTKLQPDEASQEFCDFLTWFCKEPRPTPAAEFDSLPKGALFTESIQQLVNHCKQYGVLLHVHQDKEFEAHKQKLCFLPEVGARSERNDNNLWFWQLCPAKSAPERSVASFTESGVYGERGAISITRQLLEDMNRQLHNEDADVRKISTKPVERTFVYFDISDFSKYPPGQQALIINALTSLADVSRPWPLITKDPREHYERSLCIGDGYIFVFKNPGPAVFFAAYLAFQVERAGAKREIVGFHFRAGVHSGPVFRFWDGASWNYVGKGINEGARIVEAIGKDQDDVVFISSETRDQIIREEERDAIFNPTDEFLHNRGRRRDKHGEFRRVYEVNHNAWIGAIAP
jgi:class 3 adenylate cyclase